VAATLNISQVLGLTIPGLTKSDTAFAMAFGGELDVTVAKALSVRLFQADYLFTKHDFSAGVQGVATHQNNIRLSAGIVYSFGGARENETTARRTSAPNRPTTQKGMNVAILGVVVVPTNETRGARVIDVAPNSAAALAGLHPDDIINSVNGAQVKTPADLENALSGMAAGNEVRLSYMIRGGWQTESAVTLGNQ
jgi:predicted metalloprotease with PDZ domain